MSDNSLTTSRETIGSSLPVTLVRYGLAVFGVLLLAAAMWRAGDRVNSTTSALAFLILILANATFFGRNPALAASLAAMLSLNYFFIPPVGTWHIADSENLIAWSAFTITAILAGELSAYARRRELEAARLYDELQAAFEAATEAEAFKKSEKLKSALLDAVTHDLRTPLTSIKASVTTLLDSEGGHRTIELDQEGRVDFLSIINEETDRLNGFIERMVELARIEAGAIGSGESSADIEEIVSAALARVRHIARGHEIQLNIASREVRVRGDAHATAEALYNLLENAVRYSPPGSTITIAASTNGAVASISVTDQGRGIPADMRERVFEKFFRTGSGPGGMGLGLAIAKGIVEAQNGRIFIEEGEGGIGTRSIIELPIAA